MYKINKENLSALFSLIAETNELYVPCRINGAVNFAAWDEEQIVDLIKNGSLDAFLDCLDYAPVGVIDLLKKYAVSLPMNDIKKRQALKEKTGFDVDVAIKNAEAEKAEDNGAEDNKITPVAAAPTGRRATTNYKVVSKTEEVTEEAKAE